VQVGGSRDFTIEATNPDGQAHARARPNFVLPLDEVTLPADSITTYTVHVAPAPKVPISNKTRLLAFEG
jgi:hypothetical protein